MVLISDLFVLTLSSQNRRRPSKVKKYFFVVAGRELLRLLILLAHPISPLSVLSRPPAGRQLDAEASAK